MVSKLRGSSYLHLLEETGRTTAGVHHVSKSRQPPREMFTEIHCLRLLLNDKVKVAAPTGVATFIIDSTTLHTLLSLPARCDFKQLEGNRLHQLQQTLGTSSLMKCLWLEDAQSDRCLRQDSPTMLKSVWWLFSDALWRLWSASPGDGPPTLHCKWSVRLI